MRSGGRCVKGFFLSFVLTLFFSQAHATDVTGPIIMNDTWLLADSPYVVTGNVSVESGVTLTIEAGVIVQFNQSMTLTINGTLIARGVPGSEIIFTSNTPDQFWRKIEFTTDSVDAAYDVMTGDYVSGSIIEYAVVEKAGDELNNNATVGAIELNGAHPFLNELVIQNNNASGINGRSMSSLLKIQNSIISGNKDAKNLGGGGIFIQGVTDGQIEITGNTIQSNSTILNGGGINVSSFSSDLTFSSVLIENNTVIENQASSNGGGIYLQGGTGSQIKIAGNTIQNNNAILIGGGIALLSVSTDPSTDMVLVDNNIIAGNISGGDGGGVYINGLLGGSNQNRVVGNTVNNNIADVGGGGIWVNNSDVKISNNAIFDNDAHEGGGVFFGTSLTSSSILEKNNIYGNSAFSNGGGLHAEEGAHNIVGNQFYKNKATDPSASHGGGIDIHAGSTTILNNIIAENTSYKEVLNTPGVTVITGNAILNNTVKKFSAVVASSITDYSNNTIVGNIAPGSITTINNTLVTPTANNNNIFSNVANFLFFTIGGDLNADSNWWGTTVTSEIESFVGSNTGTITTATPLSAPSVSVPISPPVIVSATAGVDDITISWNANPEADVSGYKVYWSTTPAPNFTNVADVGNATAHVIPALASDVYYVAVTAYDSDPRVDDVATKVNEDMTSGVESWFSLEQNLSFFNSDLAVAIIRDATGSVNAGDQVTYVVTVTNNGPDVANNIIMTSTLPAGATFISAPGCNENNGIVECSLVSLASSAPGNSTSFDIVIAAPVVAGTSTNTVMVSSIDKDSVGTNNTASLDFDVIPVADVSVSISAPQYVASGRSILYEVMVTNNGPSVANTVVVESTLPVGVTFNSAADGCTENAGTVTCTIGMLGTSLFNKTAIFGITVDTVGLTGVISNSVVVSAADIDLDGSNNMATVSTTVLGEADLEMMMGAVTSVTVGDSVDYQFSVKNNGPSIATNVVVVFVISDSVTLVSMSNGCEEINNELICTLNLLDSASSGTFNLMVTAPAVAGGIMASATVTADNIDPNPVNNTISVETTVNASVDTTVNERSSGGGGSFGVFLLMLLALSALVKFRLRSIINTV